MKRLSILAMVIFASVAIASSAFAGISDTKHNLSSTTNNSTRAIGTTAGNEQLCVWCHTPHAAVTGQSVPLWNKTLTTVSGFTAYPTTVGGTAPATTVNAMSRVCLTCHDGTLAINIVINAPGSGGLNAGGAQYSVFTGVTSDNKLLPGVANLGSNLSGDHPISIVYSAPNAVTQDNPASLRQTGTSANTATTWISRSKTATTIAGQLVNNYIECVSCHNPHVSTNATFLRGTTTASRICLTCHDM